MGGHGALCLVSLQIGAIGNRSAVSHVEVALSIGFAPSQFIHNVVGNLVVPFVRVDSATHMSVLHHVDQQRGVSGVPAQRNALALDMRLEHVRLAVVLKIPSARSWI
jgi:hypothetical protein